MPGLVTLRVENLNSTVRALLELGLDVEDLKDAFSEIARTGARIASREAPKGATGRLAKSVRGNRARSKAVVAAGYAARVPYAGPINFGWKAHNIAANPFMQRTDRQLRPYALRALERNINHQIRKRGLA